jgi:hypothetical protein
VCNENIANGTMDCPSCGANLKGRALRHWIDDDFDNNKVKEQQGEVEHIMTHHELLDAMLNRYTVWYWDNQRPCNSGIDSIDSDGRVYLSNGTGLSCTYELFPTKLALLKDFHSKLTNMISIEEDKSMALSYGDKCEEDDED